MWLNPRPPADVGAVTPGHAVDSSAIINDVGELLADDRVRLAQEADRLEVLTPAELVRDPPACVA